MANEQRPGATAVFEDGSSRTWVAGEGVNISSKAVAEFLRICMKPEPTQILELPETMPAAGS